MYINRKEFQHTGHHIRRSLLTTPTTEIINVILILRIHIWTTRLSLPTTFVLTLQVWEILHLVANLTITKAIFCANDSITIIVLATLSTSCLLGWWTSTHSIFRLRVRHPMIKILIKLWWNLIGHPLVELWIVLISSLPFAEPLSKDLALVASVLFLLSLASSTYWSWTIRREMFILSCRISKKYYSCEWSDTSVTNRFISP